MQEPANFQIVDGAGKVHHSSLTSAQCDAFMSVMLAGNQFTGLRSEPMQSGSATPPAASANRVPPIVAMMQAAENPLPDVAPGDEREALAQAIEAHQDAANRLEQATHAVDRAKEFHASQKADHAALVIAHESAVRTNADRMAQFFRGDSTAVVAMVADDSALRAGETKLATAKAALDQLESERAAADAVHKAAAKYRDLCIVAVKRAVAEGMVERLEAVKTEFMSLSAQIDAGRFSDVPATLRAEQAMQIEFAGMVPTDAHVRHWRDYAAALCVDPQAAWGQQ